GYAVHLDDPGGARRELDVSRDGSGGAAKGARRRAHSDAVVRRGAFVRRGSAVLLRALDSGRGPGAPGIQRDDFGVVDRTFAARFLEDPVHVLVSAGESQYHGHVDLLLAGLYDVRLLDGLGGGMDGAAAVAAGPFLRRRRDRLGLL